MKADERFARLTRSENWSGLELQPRQIEPRRRRVGLLVQIAAVGAAGVLVGVGITIALNSVRGSTPIAAPSSAEPLEFTQTPGVTTGAQMEQAPPQGFYAEWGADHATFIVVTWGSSSCPWIPTRIDATESSIAVNFDDSAPSAGEEERVCTADFAPTSTSFPTPSVVDETVPVDLTVRVGDDSSTASLNFEATDVACVDPMLSARVSASETVDGIQYYDLVVTNISAHTCGLTGPMTLRFTTATHEVRDPDEFETPYDDRGLGSMSPGAERIYRIGIAPAIEECLDDPATGVRLVDAGGFAIVDARWDVNVCDSDSLQKVTIAGPTIERTVDTSDWQD